MAAVAAGGDDGGGGWGPVSIIVHHCSSHTRAMPLASWRFVWGGRLLEVSKLQPLSTNQVFGLMIHTSRQGKEVVKQFAYVNVKST